MKKHKNKNQRCCEMCDNCIPIGEGDHYCDETQEIVIVEYEPSESYMCCHGKKFIER